MAYSLAMALAEFEKGNGEIKGLQLFASDVPQDDIKYAQGATYTESQISDLSEENKKLYLTQSVDADAGKLNWQIKDKIAQRVTFSECDLTNDFQMLEHMDLIICPEVLVYFSNSVKSGILEQFSSLLNPGGIFLTCINQAILPFTQSFERVEHPAGVFYRQKG
jgi:chemotaxis protein methyltransferase CheR